MEGRGYCCPWCKQETKPNFKEYKGRDFTLVLNCLVCGGQSLWEWGLGIEYFGPLSPPKPEGLNVLDEDWFLEWRSFIFDNIKFSIGNNTRREIRATYERRRRSKK